MVRSVTSRWRRWRVVLITAVALYALAMATRIYARGYYIFLPDYVRWAMTPATVPAGPTHVFFLFVDHFEPDWSVDRTEEWGTRYRALAARHRDSLGRPVQHTWSYPGDQIEPRILASLQRLVADGLGEVELHYHHDGDTAQTFETSLRYSIAEFQKFGFLKTVTGQTAFAFVHGNSGLDNSDGEYCGVDTELRLLHDLGCFADFTFPAVFHNAQPPSVNSIYAAVDDDRPKSYSKMWPLTDLQRGKADLMIFQGPLVISPSWSARRLFFDVEDGDVHPAIPANAARADRWVNARIHVAERPDWVFVKTWGHTASSQEDMDEFLGPHFESALTELETHFNDGQHYVLHYVTAREAYNLAMAAAEGAKGDPSLYYDSTIPKYVASMPRAEVVAAPAPEKAAVRTSIEPTADALGTAAMTTVSGAKIPRTSR
jgi:hypothetical protein